MKNYIEIGESTNILRLYIKTKDGKETGEYLEFNLKDIELLDNLQKMLDEDNKSRQWVKNQLAIIEKKQDFTKKGRLMTNNQELQYHAIKEFYNKQKDIYNMFLGENGVEKLLYGRKFEWETIQEIDKIIKEQIAPQLNVTMKDITNEIKGKYGVMLDKEEVVLE